MDNLTRDDLANLIAFVNRAQITGQEAETAATLKQKLSLRIKALDDEAAKAAIVDGEGQ